MAGVRTSGGTAIRRNATARGTASASRTPASGRTVAAGKAPGARRRVDPRAVARAEAVLARELDFIHHPCFEAADADAIRTEPIPEDGPGRRAKRPTGLPAYLAALYETPLLTPDQEVALFRKMNYLKFRANQVRSRVDPAAPDVRLLDDYDRLIAEERRTRDRIARCNLRLVVSIARAFADRETTFDELVSDGNLALISAIAKFDFGRGFRFSTYATHAIRRAFYRQLQQKRRRKTRFVLGAAELIDDAADDFQPPPIEEGQARRVRELFRQMADRLDDRERAILAARYGLGDEQRAMTLQGVAKRLGICKERVRQLQNRALDKLRDLARELRIEAPGSPA